MIVTNFKKIRGIGSLFGRSKGSGRSVEMDGGDGPSPPGRGWITRRRAAVAATLLAALVSLTMIALAWANTTPQVPPTSQNWLNTELITKNNDWSKVPGIMGYSGGTTLAAEGGDPRTVVADGSGTPVELQANKNNPDAANNGGIGEFQNTNQLAPENTNPTVAFAGGQQAMAPHLVLSLDTRGQSNIRIAYTLRDIDGATNDAPQPVAFQYRVGGSGNYTNLSGGYVPDATGIGSTQTTDVSVVLPAAANNQSLVEVRIITVNTKAQDEWIGIDNVIAASANPAIDLNGSVAGTGYSAAFTEDAGAVSIVDSADPDALTVSDADSTTLSSATATITNLQNGAAESLSANTTGTLITASYNPSTGVLTLSGTGTPAQYQQVLRTVRYNNTSQDPGATARSVNFAASDGTYNSNTATSTVAVNAVNDTPTLSATGNSPTFTEGGGAADLFSRAACE